MYLKRMYGKRFENTGKSKAQQKMDSFVRFKEREGRRRRANPAAELWSKATPGHRPLTKTPPPYQLSCAPWWMRRLKVLHPSTSSRIFLRLILVACCRRWRMGGMMGFAGTHGGSWGSGSKASIPVRPGRRRRKTGL